MLPPWVIVQTKSLAEEVAERQLRTAGYRVYLPRYRKLLLPHGAGRKPASTMRPLFARLVFVQDWHGWPQLSIGGAVGLMQARPGLAKLSDLDIAIIMNRERAGDFDMVEPRGEDLAPGDDVEFEAAHGSRIMGVLEELTPGGKAIVRALIFDRIVRTEVRIAAIRKS